MAGVFKGFVAAVFIFEVKLPEKVNECALFRVIGSPDFKQLAISLMALKL